MREVSASCNCRENTKEIIMAYFTGRTTYKFDFDLHIAKLHFVPYIFIADCDRHLRNISFQIGISRTHFTQSLLQSCKFYVTLLHCLLQRVYSLRVRLTLLADLGLVRRQIPLGRFQGA